MKHYKLTLRGKIQFFLISILICSACLIHINNVCKNRTITLAEPVYAESEEIVQEIIEEPIIEELTYDIVEEPIKPYDDETVEILTNLLYGEARGVKDKAHQAAVIWCVLNRYDTGKYGTTIIDVATAKNQFCGYKKGRVYKDEKSYQNCKNIVLDVLDRYYTEEQVGRVLPKDYLWFRADKSGLDNIFRNKYNGNYTIWDWSLESPYEN